VGKAGMYIYIYIYIYIHIHNLEAMNMQPDDGH
jgi:hypothetical protein